jgi:hypothetical protein
MTDDDIDTQLQPGDKAEEAARLNLAITLAEYIRKRRHHSSLRERINNLTARQFSDGEIDRLMELVEHFLDLYDYQQRSKPDGH